MSAGRYVLLALLLLPAAEFAAFFGVSAALGVLQAPALATITSLTGLAILRGSGLRRIVELSRAGGNRAATMKLQAAQLVILLAGALFLAPGSITDAIGLVLLPAPRAWPRAALWRVMAPDRRPGPPDGVVDLDTADWERAPDPPIEHGRRR